MDLASATTCVEEDPVWGRGLQGCVYSGLKWRYKRVLFERLPGRQHLQHVFFKKYPYGDGGK